MSSRSNGYDHRGIVRGLADDQKQPLEQGMFLVAIRPEISLQEVLVVFDEHPEQCGHAVGQEGEHVLEPVDRLNGVCRLSRMSGETSRSSS